MLPLTKCQATTRAGRPCRGMANESGFCFAHDPARRKAFERAAARGGTVSARRHCLEAAHVAGVADLLPLLSRMIDDVLERELHSVNRARAVGFLARTYYEISEGAEFERRLEALERGQSAKPTE